MKDYKWTMPTGWGRQQIQIPVELGSAFRTACAEEPTGGVKVLGTAAIALFLGLPKEVRNCLIEHTMIACRRDPRLITPESVWSVASAEIARLEKNPAPTHYIARILDPEITPPIGQKFSDTHKKKRGAS